MGIYQGSKLMSGGGGGPSPYEIAKQNGYTGTEQAFNQLLAALDQNATEQDLNNKADLVNGKVPAEQVDAYTKTEADTLLQNKANTADFQSHTTSKSNPHGVTATQTGAYTKGETDTLLQNKADKDRVVNPNLLDNWYFGNPVDQRGGYVVLAGKPIYSDAGLTNYIAPLAYPCPVVERTATYCKIKDIGVSQEAYLYAASSDCVRGYTGYGYGIDRWMIAYNPNNFAVLITDTGLSVSGNAVNGPFIMQRFERDFGGKLSGKTVTFSVLTTNGLYSGTAVFPVENASDVNLVDNADIFMYFQWSNASANLPCAVFVMRNADIKYIATKLELGSQQTLAHQDENGNWVLNEIPDYGEQLARCQRYAVKLNSKYWMPPNSDGVLRLNIPLPVTMRAKPSVTFSQESKNTGTVSFDDNLSDKNQIQFYMAANGGWVNVNNIFATADL